MKDGQHAPRATHCFMPRQPETFPAIFHHTKKTSASAGSTSTAISGDSTAAQVPHWTQLPVLASLK
jgi:hypothetical protein